MKKMVCVFLTLFLLLACVVESDSAPRRGRVRRVGRGRVVRRGVVRRRAFRRGFRVRRGIRFRRGIVVRRGFRRRAVFVAPSVGDRFLLFPRVRRFRRTVVIPDNTVLVDEFGRVIVPRRRVLILRR